MWPSPTGDKVGTPMKVISELNSWPACTPVNASPAVLPPPAHDSGSGWFAIPSRYGSFIRYSLPVLPGAFRLSPFLPPQEFTVRAEGAMVHDGSDAATVLGEVANRVQAVGQPPNDLRGPLQLLVREEFVHCRPPEVAMPKGRKRPRRRPGWRRTA